jgi:hypothetical protein
MLSPGRILLVAALVGIVYVGWFSAPPGPRAEGEFDPEVVAAHEVDAWKALKAHEDFGVYFGLAQALREEHRYNWFRAGQAGFALGRATTTFANIHSHYEQVLPDLEDAAGVQKAWMSESFDPAAVARAQLNSWTLGRLPRATTLEDMGRLFAEEFALRYDMPPERATEAAMRRAQAVQLRDTGGIDPDWPNITTALTESYRALHGAIQQTRTIKETRRPHP